MFRTLPPSVTLLAPLAATPALAAGGGHADTDRAAAREGGCVIRPSMSRVIEVDPSPVWTTTRGTEALTARSRYASRLPP